ncbi:MAG: hypothetical protein ABIN25_01800, partial [Ginsengibacter sp.]
MATSILSDKRIRVFFVIWWLMWMVLQFIVLKQIEIDDRHAIVDSIVSNILLALCCFFISYNMKFYLPRQEKYFYIIVVSFTVCSIWLLLQQGAMWLVLSESDDYLKTIRSSWTIRFGAAFLLISSMSMFSLMWYGQEEKKYMDERKSEAE